MKLISYEVLYYRTRLHIEFIWRVSWDRCPESKTYLIYRALREEALR